jgi:hypothetical protein
MLNNILNGWRPAITKLAIGGILLFLLVKCIPVLAAVAVEAKWTCGPTKEVIETLTQSGEEIIATGAVEEVLFMTFWANRSTRDWTLVVTGKENSEVSCVVLYGTKLRTQSSSRISV